MKDRFYENGRFSIKQWKINGSRDGSVFINDIFIDLNNFNGLVLQ
jgi:hypothetical protein